MYCFYGNSGWYIHGGPLLGGSIIGGSTVLASLTYFLDLENLHLALCEYLFTNRSGFLS